jgi:hypothetical protein
MAKTRNDAAIEAAILSGKLTVLHPDRGVPQPAARRTKAAKAIKVEILSETDTRVLLAVGISKQAFRESFPFVLKLAGAIWRV